MIACTVVATITITPENPGDLQDLHAALLGRVEPGTTVSVVDGSVVLSPAPQETVV